MSGPHRLGGLRAQRRIRREASITHGYENGKSRWPDEIATLEALGLANLDGMQADIERLGLSVDWERTGMLSVATAHQVPWLRETAGDGQGRFLDADTGAGGGRLAHLPGGPVQRRDVRDHCTREARARAGPGLPRAGVAVYETHTGRRGARQGPAR